MAKSTFYSWIKRYKITVTETGDVISPVEFTKTKQRVKRLAQMLEVVRTVNCTYAAPLKEKLYELKKLHGQYDVCILCEALGAARGIYYNHVFA